MIAGQLPQDDETGLAGLRLLVVEDDDVDRETVRRGFARAGVRFARYDEVSSAAEALEAIARDPYDGILLDYNIPGSDGLTLLRDIRAAAGDTPVIMLTGQGDDAVAVALMKAGAADYLSKSALTPQRLAHTLRYAVEIARAAVVTRAMETELRVSEERMRFLAEASRLLAGSLDVPTTAAAIVRMSVPRVGDIAIVHFAGDGDLPTIAAAHADPAMAAAVVAFQKGFDAAHHPAGLADEATRLGARSVLEIPLVAHGQVLGSAVFGRTSGTGFTPDDRLVAEDLAQRAATALDNARLYEVSAEARRVAEEANRTKSEFLARMSHDLRTPLNAIGGYSQLLELGVHGPVTDGQAQALGRIRRAQEHLLTLINDILSFAKLEAGQVQVTFAEHRVDSIIDELAALVRPEAEERRLALRIDHGPDDLRVRADRGRLMQILTNLTSNAVKFTEAGEVTISARGMDEQVELRVADTGPGIPPERLEAIFDPFVQARTAADESRGGGVGLGLAISRELTRLMGGELRVTSEEGHGSAFTVRLPRAADEGPADSPAEPTLAHSQGGT